MGVRIQPAQTVTTSSDEEDCTEQEHTKGLFDLTSILQDLDENLPFGDSIHLPPEDDSVRFYFQNVNGVSSRNNYADARKDAERCIVNRRDEGAKILEASRGCQVCFLA